MITEELTNYRKELEILEKRRLFLLNKINSLEVELQNIYVFKLAEIMPIIEELINKKYQSNYKFEIIEYPGNKVTKKYYYVLKEYNLDTTTLDEITLWDKIYDYNLILIGIISTKKDSAPTKISFNKKENNKNIIKFQSADTELDNLIRDFIEYVIQNELKDNKKNLMTLLNQYLKPKNGRKKQLTISYK